MSEPIDAGMVPEIDIQRLKLLRARKCHQRSEQATNLAAVDSSEASATHDAHVVEARESADKLGEHAGQRIRGQVTASFSVKFSESRHHLVVARGTTDRACCAREHHPPTQHNYTEAHARAYRYSSCVRLPSDGGTPPSSPFRGSDRFVTWWPPAHPTPNHVQIQIQIQIQNILVTQVKPATSCCVQGSDADPQPPLFTHAVPRVASNRSTSAPRSTSGGGASAAAMTSSESVAHRAPPGTVVMPIFGPARPEPLEPTRRT